MAPTENEKLPKLYEFGPFRVDPARETLLKAGVAVPLTHRDIVGSDPIGALAHLQLARSAVLMGDKAKARVAYQDFFMLWKNADPALTVLRQARAEYRKLN